MLDGSQLPACATSTLGPGPVEHNDMDTDVVCLDSAPEEPHEEEVKRVKSVASVVSPSSSPTEANDTIPPEILEVLGMPKRSEEIFGKRIPSEISERLGKILVEGLAKEQKEALMTKTLIPENFQLAKAPKLNGEVVSILIDPAKNRDKRLETMQNQLGYGIAGLADLTSELITKDVSKLEIIKRISEVNQILLDLHYEETMNRRRLIIPMLDKSFIKVIEGVKRDKYLFGENLGDNIKNTKSLEKSGLQIKKAVPALTQSARKSTSLQQGNSRAPPRLASGAGPSRATLTQPRYYPLPLPAARRPPPPPGQQRRPPPPPPARAQNRSRSARR